MDVTIGCPCPPKADGMPRHETDTVTLHEPIDPRTRRAILYDLGILETHEGMTNGDKLALMSEGYLLRCIDRWTVMGVVDGKLGPLPPSRANIARILLDDPRFGDPVTKAADELYSEAVLLPLMLGASSSSSAGRTDRPMSPPTNGRTPRRKRSTRSSITNIPMAVTGPMQASSDGASSS